MRLPGLYYPLLLLQSHPVRHICRVEALMLAESGRRSLRCSFLQEHRFTLISKRQRRSWQPVGR